ncbi:MAG: nitroreductase family protein [Nitrosopumilaceae archaeon]
MTKLYPKGYEPSVKIDDDDSTRNKILNAILMPKPQEPELDTDLFHVMAQRRSTRKFDSRSVEQWKIDKILAAADTAPTAGNFQGFEVFYVNDPKVREKLVSAANNQPYVNTPVVLVFCMNPSRVKLDFPQMILEKFSLQDATLAAAYSQLAAAVFGFIVAKRYWGSKVFGRAYLALALGYASYFVGWALWFVYEIFYQVENPYPYYPDIFYFAYYPLAIYHIRTNVHYFKRKLDSKQNFAIFSIPIGITLLYAFFGYVTLDASNGIFSTTVLPIPEYDFDFHKEFWWGPHSFLPRH